MPLIGAFLHQKVCQFNSLFVNKGLKNENGTSFKMNIKRWPPGPKRQKGLEKANRLCVQIDKLVKKQEKIQREAQILRDKPPSSSRTTSREQLLAHSECIMNQYFRPPSKHWNGTKSLCQAVHVTPLGWGTELVRYPARIEFIIALKVRFNST